MTDEHLATDPYHIQAAPAAAALPKLVLKHQDSFIVADRAGDFPAHFEGELGFYHEGTRHLRWLELRLHGIRPLILSAAAAPANDQILVGLTNADFEVQDGERIPRNTIYIDRLISVQAPHLVQSLSVSSYYDRDCEVGLEILFAADFRDVFEVRGMQRAQRGHMLPEVRERDRVRLAYRGLDAVMRVSELRFEPPPLMIAANRAVYQLRLTPGATHEIDVTVSAGAEDEPPSPAVAARSLRASAYSRAVETARLKADNEMFLALCEQSLADLQMLITETPQGPVPYAGVPWFVAPFGRDSIIAAQQLLPYNASVAAGTLKFLATWQGRVRDDCKDEESGRILHEYRRGEMANRREIPFIPYYGSVDATPLFVRLLADYVRWTGDLALARELWSAAQAALRWMRDGGDRNHDGYLDYATSSTLGLANQGWKDSEDSVSHADGTLAKTPIALAEAQAYAYAALTGAADLAEWLGEAATAIALRTEAQDLFDRFNRDFWMEREGFYALALDGDRRRCEVIASNAAHCLWTGIVPESRAVQIAQRLLAEDMFSGWGIRTLSTRERRYNPMSYHNGSVWPHDNAIAAAGFRRYRLGHLVQAVATALFDASRHFERARLPELFCGFPRRAGHGPISYPVACSPQAWAAGSSLQLLTAMLGLEADAISGRLTFFSPQLPPWLRDVEIHDLRVGESRLDVGITRGRDGASVELIGRRGDVELIVRR